MKKHSLALSALVAALALMSAGCNKEPSGQANMDKSMESSSMPPSAPQAEQAAGEMAKPAEGEQAAPASEMPQGSDAAK